MSKLMEYLQRAVEDQASDLFLVAGGAVSEKLEGSLHPMGEERLRPEETQNMLSEIYTLAGRDMSALMDDGDDDFSFSVPDLSRFRVSAYRQRGSWAAVIRVVPFHIPDWQTFGIPEEVMRLAELKSGMVLFTGTAGSGKSTTQACIVDRINRTRAPQIITVSSSVMVASQFSFTFSLWFNQCSPKTSIGFLAGSPDRCRSLIA